MKTISVIIPTYNKGKRLALTLNSFCCQTTSCAFEVIIIDGGETPNQEVTHFRSNLSLKVITTENKGRSGNRNLGIKAAEGDLLIFCDDDLIVSPSFVEEHWLAHLAGPDLLIHGWKNEIPYVRFFSDPSDPTKGLLKDYKNHRISDELFDYIIVEEDIKERFYKIKQLGHAQDFLERNVRHMFKDGIEKYYIPWLASCTANMSISRSLVFEVGLFEENFGLEWGPEDLELGYRVYKTGGIFRDAPQAQNYHMSHARPNWKSIAKNGFQKFKDMYPEEPLISDVHDLLVERAIKIDRFLCK